MQQPLIIAVLFVLGLYATMKAGYLSALSHLALELAYCTDTRDAHARRAVMQGLIGAGWFAAAWAVWRLT